MSRELPKQNWLFLRGLAREVAHWEGFPQLFEKQVQEVRVHAIDLPGNGVYRNISPPVTLTAQVEFLRAEWRRQHPHNSEPISLFALSLGAMVALQWMHLYPDEIRSAVLVNTSLRGVSPFYERLSPRAYGRLLKLFFTSNPRARESAILRLTSQRKDWDAKKISERAQIQKRHPVTRMSALRQILAALSPLTSKKAPLQPVLLLNSLGDELVHPDCSRAIAERWQVPIRHHAWAGHDLVLDDPKWVLEAVEQWCREIQSLRRPGF